MGPLKGVLGQRLLVLKKFGVIFCKCLCPVFIRLPLYPNVISVIINGGA